MDTNQLDEKNILHSIFFPDSDLLQRIERSDSSIIAFPFCRDNGQFTGLPLPLSMEETINSKILPNLPVDLCDYNESALPNQQQKRHNMELICPHKDKKHYAKVFG